MHTRERTPRVGAGRRWGATTMRAVLVLILSLTRCSLLSRRCARPCQIDGMTALTLARRQGKAEVVGILEAAAEGKRKNAASEQRGIWSGKIGQAE